MKPTFFRYAILAMGLAAASCATPSSEETTEPPKTSEPEPAGVEIVQVDAGGGHACAIDADGHVYCWGRNDLGQLGDGTTEERQRPVRVPHIDDAVQVSTGAIHTCVLHEDTTVSCWGAGAHARTGLGHTDVAPSPSKVLAMGRVIPRSPVNRMGGYRHGAVRCDSSSQLEGIVDIASGITHTCALHENGAVLCWGENEDDELGVMHGIEAVGCPAPVYAIERATDLAASHDATCAVVADGRVRCWGRPGFGTLTAMRGQRVMHPYTRMLEVEGLEQAKSVVIGTKHACALDTEGHVWCWGENSAGTLGRGGETVVRARQIEGLESVETLASAGGQICAVDETGALYCWGEDVGPMSPNGPLLEPTRVSGLEKVRDVGLGGYVAAGESGFSWGSEAGYACAVDHRGQTFCWGENIAGTLGDAQLEPTDAPQRITFGAQPDQASEEPPSTRSGKGGMTTIDLSADSEEQDRAAQDGAPGTDCDRNIEWGPADAPNYIAFENGDVAHTIRFDEARARVERGRRGEAAIYVDFQPIVVQEGEYTRRLQLGLAFEQGDQPTTGAQSAVTLRTLDIDRSAAFACLKKSLRTFGTIELSRVLLPEPRGPDDSLIAGDFEMYAGSAEFGRVHGHFETREISRPSKPVWHSSDALEYIFDGRPAENIRAAAAYTLGIGELELMFDATVHWEAFGKINTGEREIEHTVVLEDLEPGRHRVRGELAMIDIERIGIDGIKATLYREREEEDGTSRAHPTKKVPSILPNTGETEASDQDQPTGNLERMAVIVTDHLTVHDAPMAPLEIDLEGASDASSEPVEQSVEWIDLSDVSLSEGIRVFAKGDRASARARFYDAIGDGIAVFFIVEKSTEGLKVRERASGEEVALAGGALTDVRLTFSRRLTYPRDYVSKLAPDLVEGDTRRYRERAQFAVEADAKSVRVRAQTEFQPGGEHTFALSQPGIPNSLMVPVLGALNYDADFHRRLNVWSVDLDQTYGGGTAGSYSYYEVEFEEKPVDVRVVEEREVELVSGTYQVWVVEAGRNTYLVDKDGGGVVAKTGRGGMQLMLTGE